VNAVSDELKPLTYDQAVALLPDDPNIHIVTRLATGFTGTFWRRADVDELVRTADLRLLTEVCVPHGMPADLIARHPLTVVANGQAVYVAGRTEQTAAVPEPWPIPHPKVTFWNAINSERDPRCYRTVDEAYEAACTVQPYNNTRLTFGFCNQDHNETTNP
jgi:hypothetical protein